MTPTSQISEYFGTDGIRGTANRFPITAQDALCIGMAAGAACATGSGGSGERRVLIGKDTRLSCYMLESSLIAGLTSVGMNTLQVGPLPTPAIALLTRSLRADLGIMISASHNGFHDNGIKFFDSDGKKISDALQSDIERGINNARNGSAELAEAEHIGRSRRIDDAGARYAEFCKATCARELRLDGIRIVIDTANGAGYKVIPEVLWELGAEVIRIGNTPDGCNINRNVGSTSPMAMCDKVRQLRADIGFAVDGDADRIIMCDEYGNVADGDQILAMIAQARHKAGTLRGGGIVGTVMSNFGLEKWLNSKGLALERTKVGDRYVMERMEQGGFNVGGEPSGHIIISDHITTGDALITMLQVLGEYVASGSKASDMCKIFDPVPQWPATVARRSRTGDLSPSAKLRIEELQKEMGSEGRLVIRASGTEPVYRIMVEAESASFGEQIRDTAIGILENDASESVGVSSGERLSNGSVVSSEGALA